MDMNQIMMIGFLIVGAIGVIVVVAPYITGDIVGEKRQEAFLRGQAMGKAKGKDKAQDQAQRRKQIADSLKELEERGSKKKRLTLEARLAQAGLDWPKSRYYLLSAALAVVLTLLIFIGSGNPLYALAGIPIGGLGLPSWILSYLRKRRLDKFIAEFPNAVEVIIRGIKAGLPLGDCLRIIAAEAAEPVRSEFRRIVEAQSIGLTMGEAVQRLADSIPAAEANFFSIVINIQQKAGGNLSEALANLSKVLRERKKMKLKIKAMASEAKASAYIIGALPFLVSGMVYLVSPGYMSILWTSSGGRIVMAVSGLWMMVGIMSMRKMINFDF